MIWQKNDKLEDQKHPLKAMTNSKKIYIPILLVAFWNAKGKGFLWAGNLKAWG